MKNRKIFLLFLSLLMKTLYACSNQHQEINNSDELTNRKEIHFGEKTDYGEKDNIESILMFINEIQLPNMEIDRPEKILYTFDKENIHQKNPTFSLTWLITKENLDMKNLPIDNVQENENVPFEDMKIMISNQRDYFNIEDINDEENLTLQDDTEVTMIDHERRVTFELEKDDIYYYIQFLDPEIEYENFIDIVELLDNNTQLHEIVNKGLDELVDEHLIFPPYFW